MAAIPQKFLEEFMKNERLTNVLSTKGTRPVDIQIFKSVIKDVLSNKAVIEELVNVALKQGSFKMG